MGYSRREAIKCISAGTLLLMGEIYGRPIGRLAELIPGQEGNIAQKYSALSKIINLIALHPNDTKYPQILESWLAFNGAEKYFDCHNLKMSSSLYRHFLYGEGQPIDISDHISRLFPSPSGNSISHKLIPTLIERSIPPIKIADVSDSVKEIKAATLSDHPDMNQSLGNYTYSIIGNIDPWETQSQKDIVGLNLNNPRLRFSDKFDWDPNIKIGVNMGITVLSLGDEMNVPIDKILKKILKPDQYNHLLCCSGDILSSQGGALLVNSGFAAEFNIATRQLPLDTPRIEVEIPKNML